MKKVYNFSFSLRNVHEFWKHPPTVDYHAVGNLKLQAERACWYVLQKYMPFEVTLPWLWMLLGMYIEEHGHKPASEYCPVGQSSMPVPSVFGHFLPAGHRIHDSLRPKE